jgi:hypothetical protein
MPQHLAVWAHSRLAAAQQQCWSEIACKPCCRMTAVSPFADPYAERGICRIIDVDGLKPGALRPSRQHALHAPVRQ